MSRVPFLVGPTASGKTAISLELASQFQAQIISADSRQIYRRLEIGTAKPTASERLRAVHHFVDCLDPHEPFSAGEYGRLARVKIVELVQQGITPLVVGGSGLYISALADDFFTGPSADPAFRDRLRSRAQIEGIRALYAELRKVDPPAAKKILPGDYRRIERALEIYYLTGIPISELRKQKANPPPYQPILVGLAWPRAQLYQRINQRCLEMLGAGLVAEVRSLITDPQLTPAKCNALDSVGYHEVLQYLHGQVDGPEMVRLFQQNTRRFAKRQISWFKRDPRINWIEVNDTTALEQSAEIIQAYLIDQGIETNQGRRHLS